MKIAYDREADALYVALRDRRSELRSLRLTDDVAYDIDIRNRVVGIEVLRASRLFDDPDFPTVALRNVVVWPG